MITDRWAASWRATVDGADEPVQGADFLFRAVWVRAGKRVIELRYRPVLVPWLLAASVTALMAVAAASAGGGLRGRRARRASAELPLVSTPAPASS
jgi:hypothetical protein